MKSDFLTTCNILIKAFQEGGMGQTVMPEDAHPDFQTQEERLVYFTLPMALNYQRNSYTLWESALKTYQDPETRKVFDISYAATASTEELRGLLMKYKVALQPNKHVATWQTIAKTIHSEWGNMEKFIEATDGDFLILQELVQKKYKKGFPYLSGPKIFHYWSFIISTYGKVSLHNREYIEIAPDTHITKCSVVLGVITQEESERLSRDEISNRWRTLLQGSTITPIDMHPPLWFWSRNGFLFQLPD